MAKEKTETFETEPCGELIVEANERLEEQSAGKQSCSPPPSKGRCAPGADAVYADEAEIRPCFELHWGDGPKDRLETDDTEVLHIVARNPYSNVVLKDVTIVTAEILYEGGPVHRRPDGTRSVKLTPSEFIYFGDLPACEAMSNAGVGVVREVSLVNKGAKSGDYSFSFKYCHSVEFIQPVKDKLRFEVVRGGCNMKNRALVILLAILALLALLLCLIFSVFLMLELLPTTTYIYSAKYVCVPEVAGPDPQLSPSTPIGGSSDYKTVVNVHNYGEEVITIEHLVVAPNDPFSAVTGRVGAYLGPNHLLEIDCQDIASRLQGAAITSATGFVVIESPVELEVVAVYTSAIHDREKDDQTTEAISTEVADKYVVLIKANCSPKNALERAALIEMGLGFETNEIEVIVPTPMDDQVMNPYDLIRATLVETLRTKLIEKGVDPAEAAQRARDLVDQMMIVEILDVEFGLGKGHGVGRGVGIGIGAGISIDVEYLEPKVVRTQKWILADPFKVF
jgi:hypothetical protein